MVKYGFSAGDVVQAAKEAVRAREGG
jgi:hypothetical protein